MKASRHNLIYNLFSKHDYRPMRARVLSQIFYKFIIHQTHRNSFLSRSHILLKPPHYHIRQIGDKEDDSPTSCGQVCSGEEHRNQETHHNGGDHEHEQEQEDNHRITVP